MIKAQPLSIQAGTLPSGGSTYQISGCKFFLLAASEPLMVRLYSGSKLVADLEGFNGGLSVGPFCDGFTSIKVATQSGLAGNALIGVGDEDLQYNPTAGTLSFSNPGSNAIANPAPPSLTTNQQATQNQQNFGASVNVAASAGNVAVFEISSGGFANAKMGVVNKLIVHNYGAAAVNVILGVLSSYLAIASAGAVGANLFPGGAARVFTLYAAPDALVSLPAPPALGIIKSVSVQPGADATIDMTSAPVVLAKGLVRSLIAYCDTANTQINFSIDWSEI